MKTRIYAAPAVKGLRVNLNKLYDYVQQTDDKDWIVYRPEMAILSILDHLYL